jgi:hypothetical protein
MNAQVSISELLEVVAGIIHSIIVRSISWELEGANCGIVTVVCLAESSREEAEAIAEKRRRELGPPPGQRVLFHQKSLSVSDIDTLREEFECGTLTFTTGDVHLLRPVQLYDVRGCIGPYMHLKHNPEWATYEASAPFYAPPARPEAQAFWARQAGIPPSVAWRLKPEEVPRKLLDFTQDHEFARLVEGKNYRDIQAFFEAYLGVVAFQQSYIGYIYFAAQLPIALSGARLSEATRHVEVRCSVHPQLASDVFVGGEAMPEGGKPWNMQFGKLEPAGLTGSTLLSRSESACEIGAGKVEIRVVHQKLGELSRRGYTANELSKVDSSETIGRLMEQFLERISAIRFAWTTFRLAVVAVKIRDSWFALHTKVTLPTGVGALHTEDVRAPGFLAIERPYPMERLEDVLEMIRSCVLPLPGEDIIHLSVGTDSEPYVGYAHPHSMRISHASKGGSELDLGDSFVQVLVDFDDQAQVVGLPQLEAISSRLRVETDFEDVNAVLRAYGMDHDVYGGARNRLELCAVVPLALSRSGDGILVSASSPVMERLRARAFFGGRGTDIVINQTSKGGDTSETHIAIPWPPEKREGNVRLFLEGMEVGSVAVRRWLGTKNWRVVLHDYFDPGWQLLNSALLERGDTDEFECAVVKLLSLLQVPTMWYGKGSVHGRNDLASVVEWEGRPLVVLGECTGQKPSAKFTPLLQRKAELEHVLQGEVAVLPAVFTSGEVALADVRQAKNDEIALVGSDELRRLVLLLDEGTPAADAISLLKVLSSEDEDGDYSDE